MTFSCLFTQYSNHYGDNINHVVSQRAETNSFKYSLPETAIHIHRFQYLGKLVNVRAMC